jgi:hypothetical protein
MESKEFKKFRRKLGKTQKETAQLLGTSPKAVQSFEQGWRKVPGHVERQLLFLHALKARTRGRCRSCWQIRSCPPSTRNNCPAWEFKAGGFCWFISGTICHGKTQESWSRKIKTCRACEVFALQMKHA